MAGLTIAVLYASGVSLGVSLGAGRWLEMTGPDRGGLVPFAALGILLGHLLTADSIGPAVGGMVSLLALVSGTWFPLGSHGFLHDTAQFLPSYWLVRASHVSTRRAGLDGRRLDRRRRVDRSCSRSSPASPICATPLASDSRVASDRLSGWLEIDEQGERRLELTIDASSLNTGNDKRDEHLRSADFFDTERHPTVRFVSSSAAIRGRPPSTVAGELACSPVAV